MQFSSETPTVLQTVYFCDNLKHVNIKLGIYLSQVSSLNHFFPMFHFVSLLKIFENRRWDQKGTFFFLSGFFHEHLRITAQ